MIPKGLKVGDTFNDFGLTYRVTKVVGENYESEWAGETPSVAIVEQPDLQESEDYLSLPYATLKKMCAEKGLDAKGSKADLISRLEG